MQPSLKRSINISGLTLQQRVYVRIFQRLRPYTLIHLMRTSQTFYTLIVSYLNSASLTYAASENHQAEDLMAWLGLLKVATTSPKTSLVLPRFFSVTNILMTKTNPREHISVLLEVVMELLLRSKTFLSELHCNLDLICDFLFTMLQDLNIRVLVLHKPYKELSREYYLEFNEILRPSVHNNDHPWNGWYTIGPQIKSLDDVATEIFHVCRNLTSLTIPARVLDFILPNSLEMQILEEDYGINLTHLSTVLIVRAGDLEHERILSLQCHFYKHLLSLTLDMEPIPGVNHLFLKHRHLQKLTLYSSTGLVECPLLVFPSLRKIIVELHPLDHESSGHEKFMGVFLSMEALVSLLANAINISYINAVYSDYITKKDIGEKLSGLRYESLTFLRLRFFPVRSEKLERHGITSAAFARLAHKMPRLRKLTLSGFRDMLCDAHMACVLKNCPFLEELSLTGRHDVLPNMKPYSCNCGTQVLWQPQLDKNDSFDGSSDHLTVYTTHTRYHYQETADKSTVLTTVEHPSPWTGPSDETHEQRSVYLTSKLVVLKLRQIYITDVTFINLFLLGAGNTLKILWIDALPRISSIGIGLLINQVLLYGPLLTSPARQTLTQPSDFSDQIYTSLTKRSLLEHNEKYTRLLYSDTGSIDELSSSTCSDYATKRISTDENTNEVYDNRAACTDTTNITASTCVSTTPPSEIYRATCLTERVKAWWCKRLRKMDKHVCKYQELLSVQQERHTLLKITNLSFSDSYLPFYHIPKHNIIFLNETEFSKADSQIYMDYLDYSYDQLEYDNIMGVPQLEYLHTKHNRSSSELYSNLPKTQVSGPSVNKDIGPKSFSELYNPHMEFAVFKPKHQPFVSTCNHQNMFNSIYSLFSAHGVCGRTFQKIVEQKHSDTFADQYYVVYESPIKVADTIDWTLLTPLHSRDISIANATFFPVTHKIVKDKTMPLPTTFILWILSEHFETSVLEKLSVANCELVDGNLVTALATANTQSLHSLQLKLLFPIHHTVFHTLVSRHSHSLKYLYLLPFSSELENQEFINAVKQISNILTVDLDWKTERSVLFI